MKIGNRFTDLILALAVLALGIYTGMLIGFNEGFDLGVKNKKADAILKSLGTCLYHNGVKQCEKGS